MTNWTRRSKELILDEMARIPTNDAQAIQRMAERYGRLTDYENQDQDPGPQADQLGSSPTYPY